MTLWQLTHPQRSDLKDTFSCNVSCLQTKRIFKHSFVDFCFLEYCKCFQPNYTFLHFHRRIKTISRAAPLKSLRHAGIQLVTSSAPLFMCLNQDLGCQCLPAPGRTSVLHGCLMQQRPGPSFTPQYKHLWDSNDPVHCKTARVLAGACKCAQSMCVVHNTQQ